MEITLGWTFQKPRAMDERIYSLMMTHLPATSTLRDFSRLRKSDYECFGDRLYSERALYWPKGPRSPLPICKVDPKGSRSEVEVSRSHTSSKAEVAVSAKYGARSIACSLSTGMTNKRRLRMVRGWLARSGNSSCQESRFDRFSKYMYECSVEVFFQGKQGEPVWTDPLLPYYVVLKRYIFSRSAGGWLGVCFMQLVIVHHQVMSHINLRGLMRDNNGCRREQNPSMLYIGYRVTAEK